MFSDNFRRGEGKGNGRKGSKAVSKLADIGWKAFQAVNTVLPEGSSIQPKWAAEPLLKSYERTSPPLGFPRETDSLCPACVKAVRNGVISGDIPLDILMDAHPGEIKAQIVEENGQVLIAFCNYPTRRIFASTFRDSFPRLKSHFQLILKSFQRVLKPFQSVLKPFQNRLESPKSAGEISIRSNLTCKQAQKERRLEADFR
jgi:hypothetical protein